MKFRFKPEDFAVPGDNGGGFGFSNQGKSWIGKKANQLLEEHEKTLPVVYAIHGPTPYGGWSEHQSNADHFKALLWGVESLETK